MFERIPSTEDDLKQAIDFILIRDYLHDTDFIENIEFQYYNHELIKDKLRKKANFEKDLNPLK